MLMGFAAALFACLQVPGTTYYEDGCPWLQQASVVKRSKLRLDLFKLDVADKLAVRDLFECWEGGVTSTGDPAVSDDNQATEVTGWAWCQLQLQVVVVGDCW